MLGRVMFDEIQRSLAPRGPTAGAPIRRRSGDRAGHTRPFGTTLTLILSLSLSAVALAAAAPAPTTHSVSAATGGTAATLTYVQGGTTAPYSMVHLSIRRAGALLFDAPVNALLCHTECWPQLIRGNPALRVADIERDGVPDVILNLYSGGAHCCSITQIYRSDVATHAVRIVQHDFGDPGSRLEMLGGAPVFLSADDRFAYAFTAFAFSGLPVQIWSFRGGRFTDVTRRHGAPVAADAARQYRAYLANRSQGFGLGFVAAWAADEYLLGHGPHAVATLNALAAAGKLRSTSGFGPSGTAFVGRLLRFLARTGYAG